TPVGQSVRETQRCWSRLASDGPRTLLLLAKGVAERLLIRRQFVIIVDRWLLRARLRDRSLVAPATALRALDCQPDPAHAPHPHTEPDRVSPCPGHGIELSQ